MIEHKTVSLADQVFAHIEADILSGKYQRGEILTENKLSLELGVSRTPIREALRRLGQEHLIEESGKGSVVIGINEKDLEDIFLIRKQLEGIAAGQAAERRSEQELSQLKETIELQEFYLARKDSEHIKSMDNRFHEQLYRMCGSTTFYDILVPLHKKIQKYRSASLKSSGRAEASVAEHRAVFEAIASKDSKKASELIVAHIDKAYMHIKKG